MPVTIRLAGTEDIETLFDIRTSVVQNHQSRAELAEIGVTPSSVAALLEASSQAWIAEVAKEPAGFVLADAARACVFGMFVRPRFEGQGVGRRLMAQAEAFLFDHHDLIWLTTGAGDDIRANGFYRRLGWTPVGLTERGDEMRYEKSRTGSPL